MSLQRAGLVVKVAEGETIRSPIGGEVTFVARREHTQGALSAFHVVVPPREGPPLHVHKSLEESVYVLAGDLRWKLGDELHPAPTGSFVFIPRGLPHCFQNVGSGPATMLITFTPAGMEGFFERQADLAAFDLDAFRRAAAEEGMDVVGPPLAQSHPL